MKKYPYLLTAAAAFLAFGCALLGDGAKINGLITGQNAFVSSKDLVPGSFRKITVPDLPAPMPPAGRGGGFGKAPAPPEGAMPKVPAGFKVEVFAENLKAPRQVRRAPNGDLFVMEQQAGQITILREARNDVRVRHRTHHQLRNQLLSEWSEPPVGLCGQHRQRGPLPL
jgi:hypothetical protein